VKARISQVLDSPSSFSCNFVVELLKLPRTRRVFDLTFESHRSTHTILKVFGPLCVSCPLC
jgi:hypothetical protein